MTTVGRPVGPPSVRASDQEREAVVEELRQHHADGRLTLDELLVRVETAYSARTMGELMPALADLPPPAPPPVPPPALWRRLRPSPAYLVAAVVVAWIGVGLIAGIVGVHGRAGYPSSFLFLVLGFFWLRRGGWGGRPCHHPGRGSGRSASGDGGAG